MKNKPILSTIFVYFLIFFVLTVKSAMAANGSISITPQTGEYVIGQKIKVLVKINGGATLFNAAKAKVFIPETLHLDSVIIGDCIFAFVVTPTNNNPSFAGVILGGSSKSCTVYELNLTAQKSGNGNITFSDASIKARDGASEILSTVSGSNFSVKDSGTTPIEPSVVNPTEAPRIIDGVKSYDITYSVSVPNVNSLAGVLVSLDPQLPSKITAISTLNSDNPDTVVALFQNVPEGIHTITTYNNNKLLTSQIVNVSGSNRYLEIGSVEKQETPIMLYVAILTGILISILAIAIFIYLRKGKGKATPVTETETNTNI